MSEEFGYPPGDHLREEMAYRGWSEGHLMDLLGVSQQRLDSVLRGVGTIDDALARSLGDALGTGSEVWMALESKWREFVVNVGHEVTRAMAVEEEP